MANTKIKILRGLKKDLPLLDRGEIAFCTDTEELFAGDGEKNLLLSLSKEQFDELYKTTEALEIVETEVVVPGSTPVNSGIPFTKEILENITLSVTQHAAFGDLDILVDGVPQETYITWEDRGGYFYLNVDYPNVAQFNWVFVYEDGEYTWVGYTVQGDIYDTAILGSATFLISANVPFSIDRQFVLLDEVYKKNEVDTKLDALETSLETSKQDKLVAGNNITIDPDTNVISASIGAGDLDPNVMAYFNYASRFYGDKYSLLANAWESSLVVDPLEISKAQYPNGEIEGVIIPHGVTSIGAAAFEGWESNNQPLVIPHSVTSIGNEAFSDWTSNNHPLIIPDSVTSIGNEAFSYWEANNRPLVIPNSVTNIGGGTFGGWWSNNQPLVIPNSVTNIGGGAFFQWMENSHPLIIPDSVTHIGETAFSGWLLVPYVEIQATTPPTLANSNAFEAQNNAPIYVPDESVDDYKTAPNWEDLADRIFSINDKE